MSKRIFAKDQIKILLQNQNVEMCSERSISYRKDFKVLAVKKYHEGLPPNEIFKQARFDIDMIGHETPKNCLGRWRKVFKDKGIRELSVETRGRGGGRPKTNWLDKKEKIRHLEAEVAYLKEENRFLAKLRKKSLN
jgi:hypothetical protein